jgi:hypothetical protein
MRGCITNGLVAAAMLGSASGSLAADEPLSACFDAVGTFLTTNTDVATNEVTSRGLISLTNGGHFFRTDSNEGGTTGYAPFSETRGAWRCVSDDNGMRHIVATGIDFSHKTAEYPNQTLARIDYDAVYNEDSDSLSGEFTFYFVPIDGNPFDTAEPGKVRGFTFDGIRVIAQ